MTSLSRIGKLKRGDRANGSREGRAKRGIIGRLDSNVGARREIKGEQRRVCKASERGSGG